MPKIPMQIAMGVGTNGALVDVSTSIAFEYGIQKTPFREDEFRDAAPQTITFVLNNQDGRFTPGNTSSPLATLVTERMPVSWLAGTRLISGAILSIGFPSNEADWGHVTITADDMLGVAGRTQINSTNLAEAMVLGSPAYLYYPLNDPVGSTQAVEKSGNNLPPLPFFTPGTGYSLATFGVAGVAGVGDTQATFGGTNSVELLQPYTTKYPTNTQSGSIGAWNFWITPLSDPCYFGLGFYEGQQTPGGTPIIAWQFSIGNSQSGTLSEGLKFQLPFPLNSAILSTSALTLGVPCFISVQSSYDGTNITNSLYMDGVLQGTTTTVAGGNVVFDSIIQFHMNVSGGSSANLQHLSRTASGINESLAASPVTTEAGLLSTISQLSGPLVIGTPAADLSTERIGPITFTGTALLDLLTATARTEQGQLYTSSSGTLLAPTQQINLRARTRGTTPVYAFDAALDISDVPQFVRDITNMVQSVTVSGPNSTSTLVADSSLIARAGSASTSETILNANPIDQLAWGQDRLNRGKNVNLRVASITVDALTTGVGAATVTALLGLISGDRIRVSNLPTATLGFTSWDGWLLGIAEQHIGYDQNAAHKFTLYLQPVLPPTAIYDTNLWMNGGNNTLNAGITASQTTMPVLSADKVTYFEQATFPYSVIIDTEQMTVTAATAPTSGVQTLTVTRGANGTTAAGHSAGAVPEITPESDFAF